VSRVERVVQPDFESQRNSCRKYSKLRVFNCSLEFGVLVSREVDVVARDGVKVFEIKKALISEGFTFIEKCWFTYQYLPWQVELAEPYQCLP
jgi:hypothetical protein